MAVAKERGSEGGEGRLTERSGGTPAKGGYMTSECEESGSNRDEAAAQD